MTCQQNSYIFTSRIDVDLVQQVGTDASVVSAARVSTQGAEAIWAEEESERLIDFLMRNRHGTPFEHNSFTFRVSAPIFVFREFHRHRIGWSYNEESGRYKQLEPKFYVPDDMRNLTQQGKPGEYHFLPGSPTQHGNTVANLRGSCTKAYDNYLALLDQGVAKEVARMALPVNIFSTMWATANARSIMAFLSLRTNRDYAAFPSKPMREIELVAEQIEAAFQAHMPVTWGAFERNGRVCP
jgi:thymidylate synthase (FAD)